MCTSLANDLGILIVGKGANSTPGAILRLGTKHSICSWLAAAGVCVGVRARVLWQLVDDLGSRSAAFSREQLEQAMLEILSVDVQ